MIVCRIKSEASPMIGQMIMEREIAADQKMEDQFTQTGADMKYHN